MIALGHSLSLAQAPSGPGGPPWILGSGVWNDAGVWNDTAGWRDS